MQPTAPQLFKRIGSRSPKIRSWNDRVLQVLEPKGWKNTRGGLVPAEAMDGLYHGKMITAGKKWGMETNYNHDWTARTFKPNVVTKVHLSTVLNAEFELPTTTMAIRQIYRKGGFDNYLLQTQDKFLGTQAMRIRDSIRDVLHAKFDLARSLGQKPVLPIGISPSAWNFDKVRPEEMVRGDELMEKAKEGNGIQPLKGWRNGFAIQERYQREKQADKAAKARREGAAAAAGAGAGGRAVGGSGVEAVTNEIVEGSGQSEDLAGIAAS